MQQEEGKPPCWEACQQPHPCRGLPALGRHILADLLLLAPSFTLTWGLSLSLSSPRELSHNQIEELPSLHRCQKLEEM